MTYIRCAVCRGQKKVKGLGCMIKKCYACDGAGYIKQDDVEETKETVQDEIVEDTSKTESTQTKKKSHWSKKQ